MASPRKHWFRVADSILREQLTVEQRGILVGLMAWLNQRWARDGLDGYHGCRAVLNRAALTEITGRSQVAPALNALRALAQVVTLAVRERGALVEIAWPKFAEFQQWKSDDGAIQYPLIAPSASAPAPAPADAGRGRTREPAEPGSPSRLVHMLSREDGTPDAKAAFAAEMEPVLLAEAKAAHPRDAEARSAKLHSLTIRYWRAQRRGFVRGSDGRPETVAEAMARMDREEAELAARGSSAAQHQ